MKENLKIYVFQTDSPQNVAEKFFLLSKTKKEKLHNYHVIMGCYYNRKFFNIKKCFCGLCDFVEGICS